MKTLLPTFFLTFLYTLGPIFVPVPVMAQPRGIVNVTLEWHSGRQTYLYVFKGVVSRRGQPCPNAKIQIQVSAPNQPDFVQQTVASEDGSYELQVSVSGTPEQAANWKLVAQGPGLDAQAAEIEGRTILTGDTEPVVLQRPIQLVQG